MNKKRRPEFNFVPGKPAYGQLALQFFEQDEYRGLKKLLVAPNIRPKFSKITFHDKRREIVFEYAAVTNIGHECIEIQEGRPDLDGVVNFVAIDRVLINGREPRLRDLSRGVLFGREEEEKQFGNMKEFRKAIYEAGRRNGAPPSVAAAAADRAAEIIFA